MTTADAVQRGIRRAPGFPAATLGAPAKQPCLSNSEAQPNCSSSIRLNIYIYKKSPK